MKTLNLEVEIENDEDAIVVMNLLHEHNFSSRVSEDYSEEFDDENTIPPFVKQFSEEEFEAHLEEAANAPRISFEEFKRKLDQRCP